MLRYRVRHKNLLSGLRKIDITDFNTISAPGESGENKIIVSCDCDSVDGIIEGSKVLALFTIYQNIASEDHQYEYQKTEWLNIESLDNIDKSFTTTIDGYIPLSIKRMYVTQAGDGHILLHIYFDESHYISSHYEDYATNSDNTESFTSELIIDDALVLQFIETVNVDTDDEDEESDSIKIYNYVTLDLNKYANRVDSINTMILDLTKMLYFSDDDPQRDAIRQLANCIINNIKRPEFPDTDNPSYNGEVSLSTVFAFRETPYFVDGRNSDKKREFDVSIYVDKPSVAIEVPFGSNNTFGLNGERDRLDIVDSFVGNAVNVTRDLEKDMYYPMFKNPEYREPSEDKDEDDRTEKEKIEFLPIYKIKFNLHFREHRGDNWIADPATYWNGTYVDVEYVDEGVEKKVLKLMPSHETDDPTTDIDNNLHFFSYDSKSEQSDLISYLNFTNNDIKYQKNKVKKSFLRLSCFDLMNNTEQSMLSTATIFMNAGKMFTKQLENMEREPYEAIIYDDYDVVDCKHSLTGAKVDREPYGDLIKGLNNDKIEELRMSTQFVVEDTINSTSSSEGFYQYLWKDYDNGAEERDLYMKVEFNHAGYGVTVPFMMPYWDIEKWKDGDKKITRVGIKTFEEIVEDWNDTSREEDENGNDVLKNGQEGTDGPYGIKQLIKFMYIHFKYKYYVDRSTGQGKHIYYLDNETYGYNLNKDKEADYSEEGAYRPLTYNEEDGSLTLNLYEVKLDTEIGEVTKPNTNINMRGVETESTASYIRKIHRPVIQIPNT